MRKKLNKLKNLPRLPGHRSANFLDIEIGGATVRLYKAKSNRTVAVSARLVGMVGDELYQMFCHSEDEDPEAGPLGDLLKVDFDDDSQVKTAATGIVLPLLREKFHELTAEEGPGSVYWFFDRMLSGNVELDGARPETMDDLDEMGFNVAQLTRLFWKSLEMAFFPTRGDPDTSDGASGPGKPETNQARATSSFSGESPPMTGQLVQTSTMNG